MTSVAERLAGWAAGLDPGLGDLELANRSRRDTAAVALAARDHRVTRLAASSSSLREGLGDGTVRRAQRQNPPGSPARPPTPDQVRAKLDDCVGDLTLLTRDGDPSEWTWENVPGVLRRFLSGGERG